MTLKPSLASYIVVLIVASRLVLIVFLQRLIEPEQFHFVRRVTDPRGGRLLMNYLCDVKPKTSPPYVLNSEYKDT